MTLDPTDARGPGARRRPDASSASSRSLVTNPAEGTGVDRDADVLARRVRPCSSTAPIALRRSAPYARRARHRRSGSCCASWRGYSVAASGLGPVFATTSAAYLTDRRGALAGRRRRSPSSPWSATGVGAARPARRGAAAVHDARARPSWRRSSATSCARSTSATASSRRCARSRRARPSRRIASASPATCTTSSATRSPGIALQARAGRRLVERDPARAAEALREIDELASRALSETRETIGLIRAPDQPAELRPQPRLEDLDELVARLQEGDLQRPAAPRGRPEPRPRRRPGLRVPDRAGGARATSSSTRGPRARS